MTLGIFPAITTLLGFILSATIVDTLSDDITATLAVIDDTLSVDVLIESKAIRLDTIRVEGGGRNSIPLMDDTSRDGVDTITAAVRVDTIRSGATLTVGGYTLPLTDDTNSSDVETCNAVRDDTTRFDGIEPTGGG